MKRKRKRKVWIYDEQVLMLLSSVYDDKWLTSTMFMMNPSQNNLPHRKFTDPPKSIPGWELNSQDEC